MTISLDNTIDTSYIRQGDAASAVGLKITLWNLRDALQELVNGTFDVETLRFAQVTAPSAPAAGKYKLYFTSTGITVEDPTGSELQLNASPTVDLLLKVRVFNR